MALKSAFEHPMEWSSLKDGNISLKPKEWKPMVSVLETVKECGARPWFLIYSQLKDFRVQGIYTNDDVKKENDVVKLFCC